MMSAKKETGRQLRRIGSLQQRPHVLDGPAGGRVRIRPRQQFGREQPS